MLLLCVNLEPMLPFHSSNSNASLQQLLQGRTITADEPHQAVAAALPSSLPRLLLVFCHLLHRQAAFLSEGSAASAFLFPLNAYTLILFPSVGESGSVS